MKYVTIRVVNSSGSPRSNERVSVWLHQSFGGGLKEDKYTNSSGEAEFNLDAGDYDRVTIYVNSQELVKESAIRSEFKVTI